MNLKTPAELRSLVPPDADLRHISPDLQLLLRKIDGSPLQLLIELKTDTGSLSTVQKHAHEKIRAAGLAVVTCWGILAVVDALVDAISGHSLKTAYKHRDALAGSAG